MTDRPSDEAIWTSVANTLLTAVLPHVSDPQARSSALQLIALARYASRRGPDVSDERREELAAVLGDSAGQDVMRSCFVVLANPEHSSHHPLREILQRHLEEDLEVEAKMLEVRRGQVSGG